jgi:hypothetical protein
MNRFLKFLALIILIFPISSASGWLSEPKSFAECMKEELNNAKNQASIPYIQSFCFNKFCDGKGQYITIDNANAKEQCSSLYKESSSLIKNWEDSACVSYINRRYENCQISENLMSAEESRGCRCYRWYRRNKEIAEEVNSIGCQSLQESIFIYSDKTCPVSN